MKYRSINFTPEIICNELEHFLTRLETEKNIFMFKEIAAGKAYSYQSFHNWITKHRNNVIDTLIQKVEEMLEINLVKLGLMGDIEKGLTKFMLINHHDYRDKSEIKTETTTRIEDALKNLPSNNREETAGHDTGNPDFSMN